MLAEARCLFERIWKSLKHGLRQAIHMEKALETGWMGPKVGWGRASGNHQGGANGVSQVDGDSDIAPPAISVGEGPAKE